MLLSLLFTYLYERPEYLFKAIQRTLFLLKENEKTERTGGRKSGQWLIKK